MHTHPRHTHTHPSISHFKWQNINTRLLTALVRGRPHSTHCYSVQSKTLTGRKTHAQVYVNCSTSVRTFSRCAWACHCKHIPQQGDAAINKWKDKQIIYVNVQVSWANVQDLGSGQDSLRILDRNSSWLLEERIFLTFAIAPDTHTFFQTGGEQEHNRECCSLHSSTYPSDISDHQGQFSEPCQNRAAVWWRCGESASTEPDVGWATRPPRLLGEPASLLKQETFSSSRKTLRSETHARQMGGTHVKTWSDEVTLFSF